MSTLWNINDKGIQTTEHCYNEYFLLFTGSFSNQPAHYQWGVCGCREEEWRRDNVQKKIKLSEARRAELCEKQRHCSHVPLQHIFQKPHFWLSFMLLRTKINRPLHHVRPRGLKRTNNTLYTSLLSARPSCVSAALASAHYRLLKSRPRGEDKGTGVLTCNNGL